jgi:hypothetical protein
MLKRLLIVPAAVLAAAVAGCGTPLPKVADNGPAPGCVDNTGTRLPNVDQSHCVGFGRSWTYSDIRSTGQTDVGQALRDLDPSVRVTGNP